MIDEKEEKNTQYTASKQIRQRNSNYEPDQMSSLKSKKISFQVSSYEK